MATFAIDVEAKDADEAAAIALALHQQDVRVFVLVVGALSKLPSDRSRARVMRYVNDRLAEDA